jgi:hypothetical protein
MAEFMAWLFFLFLVVAGVLICDALGVFGQPGRFMRFVREVMKTEKGN